MMPTRVLIILVVVFGIRSAPAEKAAGHCTDRISWRSADGKDQSCYPYRCAPHGCLTRCKTDHDCAYPGSEHRSDGWPLACQSGQCTPYRNTDHGPEE